jgi:hypothetical protein
MKRKLDKSVRCSVRLIHAGRTAKTIRRKLTIAQAVREIGGDPVATEGRLMAGSPINKSRMIVRGVRVSLMYVADHRLRGEPCHIRVGLGDAQTIIRAGINV